MPCTTKRCARKERNSYAKTIVLSGLHSFFYDIYIRFRGENRTLFSNIRYNEIIPSSIKVSADFSKQSFRHWKRKRSIIVANELHKISMTRSAPILLFFPFSKEIRSDPGNSTWHYTVIERVPSRSDSLFESNG